LGTWGRGEETRRRAHRCRSVSWKGRRKKRHTRRDIRASEGGGGRGQSKKSAFSLNPNHQKTKHQPKKKKKNHQNMCRGGYTRLGGEGVRKGSSAPAYRKINSNEFVTSRNEGHKEGGGRNGGNIRQSLHPARQIGGRRPT